MRWRSAILLVLCVVGSCLSLPSASWGAVGDNQACFVVRPFPVVVSVTETITWGCAKVTGTMSVFINWGDSSSQFSTTNNATVSTTHAWTNAALIHQCMYLDAGSDGTVDSTYCRDIEVVPAGVDYGHTVVDAVSPSPLPVAVVTPLPVAVASPSVLPVAEQSPQPVPTSLACANDAVCAEQGHDVASMRVEVLVGLGMVVFLGATGLMVRLWRH